MATKFSMTNHKFKTENLSSSNYFQNTMGNSKNFNNSLYDSGEFIQNPTNLPVQYHFKERSGRLKWKEIMKLDIESIIRSNDLSPLENYLENLIFSSVEESDLEQLPDGYIVKLIKIFQYIMEYLLYTQQRLENENRTLESKYTLLVNESYNIEATLKENKILIYNLKKDKKEKEMLLHTYKCLIDEYKLGKLPRYENENPKSDKKYFYCDLCQGKKFSSQENLDGHINRRHSKNREDLGATRKQMDQTDKSVQLDEKFEQMKSFFETYVKNFAQESYIKIFENQKNLENKISEIKNDKLNEVKEMENQFRTTLMEMKELYLKSSVDMGQVGSSGISNAVKSNEEEKTIEKIKIETQKMSEILAEINQEQNQKIQLLVEQINSFKNTINQEFQDIKASTKKDEEKKKMKKLEKKKEKEIAKEVKEENKTEFKQENKKEFFPTVEQIASIEIKVENHKKTIKTPETSRIIEKKPNKKPFFNAGPIESDNESDLEHKIIRVSSTVSREYERKYSFGDENLKQRKHSTFSKDKYESMMEEPKAEVEVNNYNVPSDRQESDHVEEENEDEIIQPVEVIKDEEEYRPAEFSLKNKILEGLKSSDIVINPNDINKNSPKPSVHELRQNITIEVEHERNIEVIAQINHLPENKIDKLEDKIEDLNEDDINTHIIPPSNPVNLEKEKQIDALKRIEEFYVKMEERDSNSIEKNDALLYANKIM